MPKPLKRGQAGMNREGTSSWSTASNMARNPETYNEANRISSELANRKKTDNNTRTVDAGTARFTKNENTRSILEKAFRSKARKK